MEQSNQYLGEASIPRLLLKFSIPCVMGMLISAFYNIVDQIFIGNSELGVLGNAATGISFPIICMVNGFAWCIGDGAAALLSIYAGQEDTEHAHHCVGSCITAATAVSLLLTLICLVWSEPMIRLFGASDATIDMAVTYFRITAAFFPVYLLMNILNSIIRADGSPTYSMIATLTGAVINIILDPLFIFGLHWGIAGAAWATVIGQTAAFLLCSMYFFKPRTFRLQAASFVPNLPILKRTISMGGATFFNQLSIVAVSLSCNLTLFHYGSLSVYGPDIPISVFNIQTKVYTIICSIVIGIVLGGQPIFGFNYGAGKFDRVRQAYRCILLCTLTIGTAATLIFQFCPQIIISLFGQGDPLYWDFAMKTFRIYLSLSIATYLVKMSCIFFQSIGKPLQAVLASMMRDLLFFLPLLFLLPIWLERREAGTGIYGILYAAPIADAASCLIILSMTIPFFRSLKAYEAKAESQSKTE